MATIDQDIEHIRHAIYGRDVREAIADGLEHCYADGDATIRRAEAAANSADSAASSANTAASNANSAAGSANSAASAANAAAATATQKGNEAVNIATQKGDQAVSTANTAAANADQKAAQANQSALNADRAAASADSSATNANTAASGANLAADNAIAASNRANASADNADEKADYAYEQGNHAANASVQVQRMEFDAESIDPSLDGTVVVLDVEDPDGLTHKKLVFYIPRGKQGEDGKSLAFKKMYSSIEEMEADYDTPDVDINEFVMINSGVGDIDHGKVYFKDPTGWIYGFNVTDSAGIVETTTYLDEEIPVITEAEIDTIFDIMSPMDEQTHNANVAIEAAERANAAAIRATNAAKDTERTIEHADEMADRAETEADRANRLSTQVSRMEVDARSIDPDIPASVQEYPVSDPDGLIHKKYVFNLPKGVKGDRGQALAFAEHYDSIAAMEADFDTTPAQLNDFVVISSGILDRDNGKVYMKGRTAWIYSFNLTETAGVEETSAYFEETIPVISESEIDSLFEVCGPTSEVEPGYLEELIPEISELEIDQLFEDAEEVPN